MEADVGMMGARGWLHGEISRDPSWPVCVSVSSERQDWPTHIDPKAYDKHGPAEQDVVPQTNLFRAINGRRGRLEQRRKNELSK